MYTIWTRLRGGRRLLVAAMAVTGALALAVPGFAAHPEASLPGSNFELDIDANLKVDDPVPSIDWASVSDSRQPDLATGRNDDSYAGGTKEDDACPGTTTGSIPNNKSDLLTFGAYVEDPPGLDPGYLHVFWSRVNEPSGTTLMDFELNQSSTDCGNGVNPVRTEGDLLIEYRIEQGGATATIKVREWTGTAWGEAADLTGTQAAGTINNSAIPAADSDGLITTGSISPRTFGEASLDLDFIFDEGTCESFGSAFLKSRASDSFTSQLKDFIEPTPVDIQNCGAVEITKTDDVGTALAGAEFTLYEDDGDADFEPTTDDPVATDQDGNPLVCTTAADGTCSIQNVVFDTYWIDETVVPVGHDKAADLPQKVTVDSSTTVELTFANPRQRGSIVVEKEDEAGNPLAGAQFALDADGDPATTDDQTPIPSQGVSGARFCIDNLLFGDYVVVETGVPDGYTPQDPIQEFTVSEASTCAGRVIDDPDLTFVNLRNPGAIRISKSAKDVNAESGSSGLGGVEFTITDANGDVVTGSPVTTNANGEACIGGLAVGATYTVTESDVPAGFQVDPTVTQDVTVLDDATCDAGGGGESVSFTNDPLSKITVSFESLATNANGEDRTAATIDCTDLTATPADDTPTAFDDASEEFTNLKEGTYNCTVVIDP